MAIRLDKDAINALQLDIDASVVRTAIAASKLKVKEPQITCVIQCDPCLLTVSHPVPCPASMMRSDRPWQHLTEALGGTG